MFLMGSASPNPNSSTIVRYLPFRPPTYFPHPSPPPLQAVFTQSLLHETAERRAELMQRCADPLGDGWIGNQVGGASPLRSRSSAKLSQRCADLLGDGWIGNQVGGDDLYLDLDLRCRAASKDLFGALPQ